MAGYWADPVGRGCNSNSNNSSEQGNDNPSKSPSHQLWKQGEESSKSKCNTNTIHPVANQDGWKSSDIIRITKRTSGRGLWGMAKRLDQDRQETAGRRYHRKGRFVLDLSNQKGSAEIADRGSKIHESSAN